MQMMVYVHIICRYAFVCIIWISARDLLSLVTPVIIINKCKKINNTEIFYNLAILLTV